MQVLIKIARIAASAAVIIAILLLGLQCIDIYIFGSSSTNLDENGVYINPVYTKEDVAERLSSLSIPLAACIAVIAASVIIQKASGEKAEVKKGIVPEYRLKFLKQRVLALPDAAKKEEKLRRILKISSFILIGALCVFCAVYFLGSAAFPPWNSEGINAVVIKTMLNIVPPSVIVLVFGIINSFIQESSMQKEISVLKYEPQKEQSCAPEKNRYINRVRAVIFAAAVVFILLGVMNGGLRDVLYKAVNICTECIGLG